MPTLQDPKFQQFLSAERSQESGGNYGARSGAGALGAYQVMPGNIASWSKQVLGYSISASEFVSNHALQDQIVANILLGYVNKYGYAGAAAMWFSGQPNPNSNSSDGGTTVSKYVSSVLGKMGNTPIGSAGAASSSQDQNDWNFISAFPAATPTLSLDSLKSQDPLVAALVTSIPEITKIFQDAVAGSWSPDKFISSVQNTNWWATHSDTARQIFLLQKTDPASWHQQVTNLESSLTSLAATLGASPTGSQLNALAIDALTNGYDNNQAELRQKFSQYVNPVSSDHFGGEAGTDETSIRDAMRQLGVTISEPQLQSNIKNIIGGTTDVQSVLAQLRTQAAATYPAYANQINQGMNVSDIADPYMQQAQQILEKGPGEINIFNPMIKKALQNTVGGKPAPMSLTDFEINTRKNPAWMQTNNAQTSMMQTAHQVLTNFGLQF